MSPHVRSVVFFFSLLAAPAFYALGDRLGGAKLAVALCGLVVVGGIVLLNTGGSAGPPEGPASR